LETASVAACDSVLHRPSFSFLAVLATPAYVVVRRVGVEGLSLKTFAGCFVLCFGGAVFEVVSNIEERDKIHRRSMRPKLDMTAL
jgi:hypothetical protein